MEMFLERSSVLIWGFKKKTETKIKGGLDLLQTCLPETAS
jgi:hypothetical protein